MTAPLDTSGGLGTLDAAWPFNESKFAPPGAGRNE